MNITGHLEDLALDREATMTGQCVHYWSLIRQHFVIDWRV
jgi:hypothetical protein